MPKIEFLPDKRVLENIPGQTLLETSLANEIPHTHACGGKAKCSSCRVIVSEGRDHLPDRNAKEQRLADLLGFKPHIRLACQTVPTHDMTVRRPILDEIDLQIIAKEFEKSHKSLGEERNVSILFADIEGYTTLTENALPYDIVHMLNRYFYSMGKIIQNHDGLIMDYFGDGFLAIFGMEDDRNHALDAVRAGDAIHEEMERLSPYFEDLFGQKLKVRIGVNSGNVIVGSIGIRGMQKLAAIGDAVNLAARIEETNKQFGTRYLISQSTRNAVGSYVSTSHALPVEIKGKAGKYHVYEVLEVK